MNPDARDTFQAFSLRFEGLTDWMYLDILGLVTIGVGNLIDPLSTAFAFDYVRTDGSPASHADVSAAWTLVKSRTDLKLRGGGAFKYLTTVRATRASIDRVFYAKLDANEAVVRRDYLPSFDALPSEAQTVIMSMAWAAGAHIFALFPKFLAAVRAGDWSTAADECRLDDRGNRGLTPRNEANRRLLESLVTGGQPCAS